MTFCFQNSWTEKTKTSLHQMKNEEILKEMSLSIVCDIFECIKNAAFYGFMVGETSDDFCKPIFPFVG